MQPETETGVFRSPSGLVRLDIPRAGTNLRELFDAKVERGELEQIPDDAVVEVVEVYGADKNGDAQTLTRLVYADPPPAGAEKRAALGNEDPVDPPRVARRPGRPTKAEKAARVAAERAELEAQAAAARAELEQADADVDDEQADTDVDDEQAELDALAAELDELDQDDTDDDENDGE